ncbi:hypothetical protein [Cellulomonas triticagri]|uniref:DUF2975 domain-containing protein n=1 Tax=Cellulomonas triticagri TaxID=2483352 RepID=A0A3M2JL06_9CELL|nr:hypothetical protein [Cellulomonas triticagri]RMI12550.1 hypothetical protein EBM89_08230 [Cellulomonas triticagri]
MPPKAPWFARPSDLWSVLLVGGAVIAWNAVTLVRDLVRLLPNQDVQVDVLLRGVPLDLPIGPGGATVAAHVDTAGVTVPDMPPGTYVSALGAAVVPPLATIAITVCVLLLCRQMLGGQFFSQRATRLITAVSLLIAGGWFAWFGFSVMASNGALALVADPAVLDAAERPMSWTPILAAMAVGALAAAFHAGERMQRDAEGLV